MTDLPQLTKSKIQQWVSDDSFCRGERYYREGRIVDACRQAGTLMSRCVGSQPEPYRVEIFLGVEGIVSAYCSCPIGGGGRCKHVAALLLTWLHEPETFHEIEALETRLARRSKSELVALASKMIERYPDLEVLLELPTPGHENAGGDDVAPESIQRLVNVAFSQAGNDWRSGARASADLQDAVRLGDEYAEYKNWRNAATVYETVARGVLESWETVYDDEGDLSYVVNECAQGLARCLEAADDPRQRQGLLRALFDIYRWDVDAGGYGIGDEVPEQVLALAGPEERSRVAEWVRNALPEGDSWGDGYRRQAYGGFLLSLLQTELDDNSYLQICRETGRLNDLADRLLMLDRVDEAAAAARGAEDYDLLHLADLCVSHGQASLGEEVVRERAGASSDGRLTAWLKTRAEERGDRVEALALAETLFWQRPSLAAYVEMRRLAEPLEKWTPIRTRCLGRLEQEENLSLLVRIYVLEGEIDRALETFERCCRQHRWGSNTLAMEVAQAAEESRPREAIRLYLEEVERLIAGRGRGNYAQAADYLLRVRAVYGRMGEEEAWQRLIANLREKHRRLPAMKDEFTQAGL